MDCQYNCTTALSHFRCVFLCFRWIQAECYVVFLPLSGCNHGDFHTVTSTTTVLKKWQIIPLVSTTIHRLLPENISIDGKVVFYRHCRMSNNLFAEAINGYNMGDPKHSQLFILVHMNLVTHVLSFIWYGVEIAGTLKETGKWCNHFIVYKIPLVLYTLHFKCNNAYFYCPCQIN